MKKLVTSLMLVSALTACDSTNVYLKKKDEAEQAKKLIENNPNIVQIEKIKPGLDGVMITYDFDDSTQTITKENSGRTMDYYTFSFSRRGFDDLRGTERKELDSLCRVRKAILTIP